MELATLNVDRDVARRAMADYRRAVHERHNAEDELILKGYREIVRGNQVIDIVRTIRSGGVVDVHGRNGRRWIAPCLAVARADAQWCRVRTTDEGAVTFYAGQGNGSWSQGPRTGETKYLVQLPERTIERIPEYNNRPNYNLRAMVPTVPPALRPKAKLDNYHILWEAEWDATAPKDPALLKHIGGDLYAVLAVWDLTELERAVLGHRR